MTAYCTPADVRLAVDPSWIPGSPEPQTGAQDASQLSDAQIRDAIAQASAQVDSFIGGRYQTPVAPVDGSDPVTYPDQLVHYWTRDLAAYLATLTYFRHQSMESTEPVYLRATAAMSAMAAVRDGKGVLNLPPAASGDANASAGGYAGAVDSGTGGIFDAADAGYHRGAFTYGSGWSGPYGPGNTLRSGW